MTRIVVAIALCLAAPNAALADVPAAPAPTPALAAPTASPEVEPLTLEPFDPVAGGAAWWLHDWYPYVGVAYFSRNSSLETPSNQHGIELRAGYADFWEVEVAVRLGLTATRETVALARNQIVDNAKPLAAGLSLGLFGIGRSSFTNRWGIEPSFGLWSEFRLARIGGESADPSTLPDATVGPYFALTAVGCGPRFRASFVPVTVGFGHGNVRADLINDRAQALGLQGETRELLADNLRHASLQWHATLGVDWAIGRRRNTCQLLGR